MSSNSIETETTTGNPEQMGWRRIFACDLRSLAMMRILLGSLILIDLVMRSTTMTAMYTDQGFFPISERQEHVAAVAGTSGAYSWSLHAWDGSLSWQVVLFGVAGLFAVMLVFGFMSRLATIVSWVLLVSLQMRNPLILHSGDVLLRVVMFWCMFLPLGSLWSVDAWRDKRKNKVLPGTAGPVVSGATCGLLLTIFSLYVFAGIAKLNSIWFSGDALEYVMRLDIYANPMAGVLLQQPVLMKLVTWLTLVSEILFPFALFIWWKNDFWRMANLLTFVSLHIGIALCMNIGLFSWISISVWVALLPASFWEKLRVRLPQAAECCGSNCMPTIRRVSGLLANAVCLFFAAYFLMWNVATISHPVAQKAMPTQGRWLGQWTNLSQSFRMFDVPPKHSPWFVYEARLENGAQVDIFRNAPVSHERPDSVQASIPTHHWRRLHRNLARPVFAKFRQPVSDFMVRQWNATHDADSQIVFSKTTAYLDEINPGDEFKGRKSQVWHVTGNDQADRDLFEDLLKQIKERGTIYP